MKLPAPVRRLVVLIAGGAVLLAGVVMIFTPGPGLAVMLVGLATLATEFPWARRLLRRLRRDAGTAGHRVGDWWRRRFGRGAGRP